MAEQMRWQRSFWVVLAFCLVALAVFIALRAGRSAGMPPAVRAALGPPRARPKLVFGWSTALFLAPDGSLWGWGDDRYMRLLGGGPLALYAVPQRLGTNSDWIDDSDWKMVAAGSLHGLALKPNGTLWGWGGIPRHSFGKGGPTPRQMGSRQDWIFIWAAQDNGAGLTADGKLWLWGACLGEEPTLPVMDQVARAMGDLLRSHGVNSAWGRSQRLDYRHSSIPWCVLEFTNLPPGKLMGARFAPETLVDEK